MRPYKVSDFAVRYLMLITPRALLLMRQGTPKHVRRTPKEQCGIPANRWMQAALTQAWTSALLACWKSSW